MTSQRIVATGTVPRVVAELLGRFGSIQVAGDARESTLLALTSGTIGLVARGDARVTRRIIEESADLRVIGRSGVGFDNVDIEAATERRIPVVVTPGAGATAVAEGAMALLLALIKRLPELDRQTRTGCWQARSTTRIEDMEGHTLGVVGLGRIGREVVRLASGFRMSILGYDPYVTADDAGALGIRMMNLDDLLATSDFVTLHAPLTAETKGMLDRRRLSLMRPGAFLINVARGALFESLDAVLDALNSGQLAGLGIDVYPEEPPDVSHPLFSHPNVLCTPHAMGASVGATDRVFRMMCEGMAAVLDGGMPRAVANPEVLNHLQERSCS